MNSLTILNSELFIKSKHLLLDVDGVMTDGSLFYSENGEVLKVFNVKDGLGIKMLLRYLDVFVITSNPSEIVKKRCTDLGIKNVYLGIIDKRQELIRLKNEFKFSKENIVYIGDDLNDLSMREEVGCFLCPIDAASEIKKISDFIIPVKGGGGVVRYFADIFLSLYNDENFKFGDW